jgi:osmotically-inducible protein OsmY
MNTTNRELQEMVLNALEWEPGLDAGTVGVTVKDGIVTLTGRTTTLYGKWTAERAARHVFGVRAVANDIEVAPDEETTRTDADIAEAAANGLTWNASVPLNSVQATVRQGWITLTGTVDWHYQRQAAERAVEHLYGVKGVANSIVLKPRASAADVKTKIEQAFTRSAEVDATHVQVEARDGQVILRGTVKSLNEREEAERAAWAAPGVKAVDDRIIVAP